MNELPVPLPAGACDCHLHVFGPHARFALAPGRSYTPPEATLADYEARAAALGLSRMVLVQPSPYGTDNACLLDALARAGGKARGIVALGPDRSDEGANDEAALAAMDAAGVRGVRVTLNAKGSDSPEAVAAAIARLGPRMAARGWHIQVFASLASIAGAAEAIRAAPVPVVLDHMGLARPGSVGGADFARLLSLLSDGRCWVKLSGADRITGSDADFAPALPVMRALADANSEHLVWGSDWPHTARHAGGADAGAPAAHRPLDDAALLRLLIDAVGTGTALTRILSDNPGRLYGFSPS